MATRKSTSKVKSVKSRQRLGAAHGPRSLNLGLEEAIEVERGRLMKADSILGCASLALDYGDNCDPRKPYYPDVVDVARDLISESALRLDAVNLKPLIVRMQKSRPRR